MKERKIKDPLDSWDKMEGKTAIKSQEDFCNNTTKTFYIPLRGRYTWDKNGELTNNECCSCY